MFLIIHKIKKVGEACYIYKICFNAYLVKVFNLISRNVA